ncbi:MAG TPA: type II secretion system protein N, partial [Steroidobacteraceae bacterium]|nr:type II secretion system protein N [Steroidobacteraceae bacterium]
MRRGWLLLALGLGAYLVFVVATLPASLVASRLADRGIESAASSGTVWEGRLTGVRSGQNYLGDVQWTLHPARLLAARAAAHIELTRPDGRAAAHV